MSQELIKNYLKEINEKFKTLQATEHTYRSALQILLEGLNSNIIAINESKRRSVGMPDFTIKDKKKQLIEIWGIEAKDLYIDLEHKKNSDQLDRYLSVFDNFIYTNNLEFVFYRNKKKVKTITLWVCDKKTISWKQGDELFKVIEELELSLKDFLQYEWEKITSPSRLAKAMAKKAQQIKYAIIRILEDEKENASLFWQYKTFKELLVHDLTEQQFADMYAQTVAYWLFSARLYDPTLENFSRQEAERLIPKSTPFIRWLFKQISNDDEFDNRVAYIIDDLINIFLLCNVAEILQNYGKSTQMQDPIIHFYETFLWEYDASMRKKRWVYYTPEPVVKFIVKGVDAILKKEFDLSMWLADTSKIDAEFKDHTQTEYDKRYKDGQRKIKKTIHRVQVLDPATGTGTFLNETIKYIHDTYFQWQAGMWTNYIENDLLPRIWGFEILMASYTMAHLKLGLTLSETGWHSDKRVNIYLTNSLEEPHDTMQTLFSQQLARESQQASKIKREQPIMIVMGNPPYAVSSSNKWEWIQWLIADYKKDLNERKINLDDDYIKFIRYAQYFIDKNSEWIIGMITNNSYIDGITHRQMRKELMKSFDKIYIYDLHGNSKKKETAPDGSKDENVFDIMQGVSIIFAIKKTEKTNELAEIYHYDSYWKRDLKYQNLLNTDISNVEWTKLNPVEPYYFFVPKDFSAKKKYDEGVKVSDLFNISNSWIQTKFDKILVIESKKKLEANIKDIKELSLWELEQKYWKKIWWWKYENAKNDLKKNTLSIQRYTYRPFDFRYIPYTGGSGWILWRSRSVVMAHFLSNNIWICLMKQVFQEGNISHFLVSKNMIDERTMYSNRWWTYFFPLYLYNEDGSEKKANFDSEIIKQIEEKVGMTLNVEDQGDENYFTPEDLFDYIYAVLHSPNYREKYKEFLKIDFPRIPITDDKEVFWKFVEKGSELRKRHLMEHPDSSKLITQYPETGDNIVEKPKFVDGKVYINKTQYFDNVPELAWNFYIWWYQPAQKRLKDRKNRELSFEDILHWQKIVVALVNTDRVMGEIDEVWEV